MVAPDTTDTGLTGLITSDDLDGARKKTTAGLDSTGSKLGGGRNYILSYYGPSIYQDYGYSSSTYDSSVGSTSQNREFKLLTVTSDFFLSDEISAPQPFTMSDSGFGSLISGTDGIEPGYDSTDGAQFQKRVLAARIRLPPTKTGAWSGGAGFLDPNSPFQHKIQQRYMKFRNEPGTPTADPHATWLNVDIGFEGDIDGIPFEEWYVEDYPSAPWTSICENFEFLARINQFYYGWDGIEDYREMSVIERVLYVAAVLLGQPWVATASEEMFDGDWSSYGYARTPIQEVFYYASSNNLTAGKFFYEDVDATSTVDGFDRLGGSSTGPDKFFPKANTDTDSIVNHTYGASEGFDGVSAAVYLKIEYDYKKSGDGKETWEDIEKRFKSLDYVKTFSSELISHRLDQVAALLTTSISREADIKMQKNEPLRHTLATAMADDYSTMDTPETSVSSTGIDAYSSADPMGTTGGGGGGTY